LTISGCDTSLYHPQGGATLLSLCDPDRKFGICIFVYEHPNFQFNYWTETAVGFRASHEHLPTFLVIILGTQHREKDANDYSYVYFTLILSLHYPVKFRSYSLTVYNNEFILSSACVASEMANKIVTNTTGNYCFSKSHVCHITLSLLQHVFKMPAPSTWWTLAPLTNSTFDNRVTQSGPLAVDA